MMMKISNTIQPKNLIIVSILITLVFTTHLHGAQVHWEPIGFSAGGLFLVIAVDPVETNVLYVGADVSGLYKSVDYGESWKHINVGLESREIASFAINPSNHLHLWTGTPMGLYSSQNGGESWSLVNADIRCFKHANHKGITISQDGQTILVASHYLEGDADPEEGDFNGKLYRSSDGGASWAVVQEFSGKRIPSVMFDPYTLEQAFLLVAGQGILRSTNGGQTWEDFSEGLPSELNWKNLDVGKTVIYATATFTKPYKSSKDTASWESIRADLPEEDEDDYAADAICVSPADDNIVYLGQAGWPSVFYKSTNGGKNWQGNEVPDDYTFDTVHAPHQSWNDLWQVVISIAADPKDPERLYYTTWWGAWRSDDGGESWQEKVIGTQNTCCTGVAFSDDTLLSSHMDVGVLSSSDLGATWLTGFPQKDHDQEFVDQHAWGIEQDADGNIYVGFSTDKGPKVFRSENNGVSWQDKSNGLPEKTADNDIFLVSIAADPNNSGTLYLAIDDLLKKGLFHTTNYGDKWKRLKKAPGSEEVGEDRLIKCLEVDPTDSDRIFAGLYWDGLWYSENGGQKWHLAEGNDVDLSYSSVQQIVALEDGTVFAAYDDGLYKSVDHGHTFSRAFPDLPNLGEDTLEYVYAIAFNPADTNEIFVSTSKPWPLAPNRGSVWHSKDGGIEWIEITGDLPVKNVVDLTYRDGYLYAATWCANVYRANVSK